MPAATPVEIDSARVEELTARELQILNERTATSERMYGRASKALSAGVASSYQLRDPWPIYLASGEGAPVVDYESFKANQDVAVTELAWLWNMNRGVS